MRVFSVGPGGAQELDSCPTSAPEHGFLWLALERAELETDTSGWQQRVLALTGIHLVDLHISDLINAHLPSRYDYTDSYDLLVFRRLAAAGQTAPAAKVAHKGGPPVLRRIDTSPVGFALFDHLLLSVHPSGCGVLAQHASRLLAAGELVVRVW